MVISVGGETDLVAVTPGVYVYTIRLPNGTPFQPDLAYSLTNKLVSLGAMIFRVVAEQDRLDWQIVDAIENYPDPSLITQAVRSVYPEAEVEIGLLEPPPSTPFHRIVLFFKQSNLFAFPLRLPKDLRDSDPLSLIANTLAAAGPDERISYLVSLGGA